MSLPILRRGYGYAYLRIMNRLFRRFTTGLSQSISKVRRGNYIEYPSESRATDDLALELIQRYPNPYELMAVINDIDISEEMKKDILMAKGGVLQVFSHFHQALDVWKMALEYSHRLQNPSDEAMCYGALGQIYRHTGEFQKSVDYLEMASNFFDNSQDTKNASIAYTSLGNVYFQLSDFKNAIMNYKRALGLLRFSNDRELLANCLNGLGSVYSNLGDYIEAIPYYDQALDIFEQLDSKQGKASVYINLAQYHITIGNFSNARKYVDRSLELSIDIGDKRHEADCLSSLAQIYYAQADTEKAVESDLKALSIYKEIGDKHGEIRCYNNIGVAYMAMGEYAESVEYFTNALNWHRQQGDLFGSINALKNLGNVQLYQKDYAGAYGYYRDAADLLDKLRQTTIPESYHKEFWTRHIETFDNLILTAAKLNRLEDALTHCEMSRSTILLDMMSSVSSKRLPIHQQRLLNYQEIKNLAIRIQKNIMLFRITDKGSYTFLVNRKGHVDVLENEHFDSKRLKALLFQFEGPEPVDGCMATYMRYKESQSAVVHSKSKHDFSIAARQVKECEIKWHKAMEKSMQCLQEELLQNAFQLLRRGEKVVIVPSKALSVLPLHAAFSNDNGCKHYLIEDYEITYAPNCRILDLCHKREEERKKRDTLFAVANPVPPFDLEYSEWEVKEISKFFYKKEVNSKQYARDVLLSDKGRWSVIHLATHGLYDLSAPLYSQLSLGENVSLTLEDVVNRGQMSECWLMCLSACESGLSDYRDVADEQIGFQTAFLSIGIPTVIGSLWTVDDFTTSLLMIKMYDGIFNNGNSKAQGLRNAQLWLKDLTAHEVLEIIKGQSKELDRARRMLPERLKLLSSVISIENPDAKIFSHPYYWAGFQLFGV